MTSRALALLATATGLIAVAAPAHAIGVNVNDRPMGVQVLNNVSVLPIQMCNSSVDLVGLAVPLISPVGKSDCGNAPVGDHSADIITGNTGRP